MRSHMGGTLAAVVVAVGGLAAQADHAGAQGPVRSDVESVVGHYDVSNGYADRNFYATWANSYFANGLGVHAEIDRIDREERATYYAGGLSYNTERFSIRGTLGSSTDNFNILPDFYARLETTFRSSPQTGWVLTPAVTYREYNNGADETELQGQVLKYVPVGPTSSLIFQGLVRSTWIDIGDHFVTSVGGGIMYSDYRKFSVGVAVEGGRTAYDATFGIGSIDEAFFAVRPSLGIFLTDKIEFVAQGEFSMRDSYDVMGGHVGLKFHLD